MSQALPFLQGVAIYTMFRGRTPQLIEWINFHINQGAEKIYVYLDRPDKDLLSSLPKDDRLEFVTIEEADLDRLFGPGIVNVEKKQVNFFYACANKAHREGFKFIAFIDCDELIRLQKPLSQIVNDYPIETGAYLLPVKEVWRAPKDDIHEDFSASLAIKQRKYDETQYIDFGDRTPLMRGHFLGQSVGKTIYKLPLAHGDMNVHQPKKGELSAHKVELTHEEGSLLHFDCGSVTSWQYKWHSRASKNSIAIGMSQQRTNQGIYFSSKSLLSEKEVLKFYRDFFSIDKELRSKLKKLNYLEQLNLADELNKPFDVPKRRREIVAEDAPLVLDERVDYQFAFVTDDNFATATFASILSVLLKLGKEHSFRIVVLGDGIKPNNIKNLERLNTLGFDIDLRIHDITEHLDRDIGKGDKKRATFGRIYLLDFLPRQRTIYLDGDILATHDFSELFDMDLKGAAIAGATDSAALRIAYDPDTVPREVRIRLTGITGGEQHVQEYLNGGVLILDLEHPQFIDFALAAKNMVYQHAKTLKQRDQDALNIAFKGSKYILPMKYNFMTQFVESDRASAPEIVEKIKENIDATLIHFSGRFKPWLEKKDTFYNGLYRRMVQEIETQMGISCGFYFSSPVAKIKSSRDEAEFLRSFAAERGDIDPINPSNIAEDNLVLLAVVEDKAYLNISEEMLTELRSLKARLSVTHSQGLLASHRFAELLEISPRRGFDAKSYYELPLNLATGDREGSERKILKNLQFWLDFESKTDDDFPALNSRYIGSVPLFVPPGTDINDPQIDGAIDQYMPGKVFGHVSGPKNVDLIVAVFVNGDLFCTAPVIRNRKTQSKSKYPILGFKADLDDNLMASIPSHLCTIDVRVSGLNLKLKNTLENINKNKDFPQRRFKSINRLVYLPMRVLKEPSSLLRLPSRINSRFTPRRIGSAVIRRSRSAGRRILQKIGL